MSDVKRIIELLEQIAYDIKYARELLQTIVEDGAKTIDCNIISSKIDTTNSILGSIAGSGQNSLDDVYNELEWIYKNTSEFKPNKQASKPSTQVESGSES